MDALNIQKGRFLAGLIGEEGRGHHRDSLARALQGAPSQVSGYLVGSPEANKKPLPPRAELQCGTNTTLLLSVAELAMTIPP